MRFVVKLDLQQHSHSRPDPAALRQAQEDAVITPAAVDSAPFALLSISVVDDHDLPRPEHFKQQIFSEFYDFLSAVNQALLHELDQYADAVLNDNENAALKSQLLARQINFEEPLVQSLVQDIRDDLSEQFAALRQELELISQQKQLAAAFNEDLNTLCSAFLNHLIAELYVRADLI